MLFKKNHLLFEYNLQIPFVEENLPKNYKGNAEFVINRDNESQWVIVEWADIKTQEFPSWSELKGRLYL